MIQKLVNTQQTVHLYEVLDYLVTPACSRIDTGVYATTDITAEMTVNFTNTTSGAPRLFSTHDSSWDYPGTWGLSIENVNIPVVFPLGYQGNFPVNYAIQQNVDYRFRLEGSGLYTLYDSSDNVLYTQDFSSYTSSITSDTSIYLFFFRDSHEYITQDTKVYSCKIWDNGVLIKDYIPVKRLSDNKYGMYDNVSRTFHPNEISGYDFSGVSKSVPEYIDEQQSNTTYVNDIKFNGSSINRIYLNGEVYWGNDPSAAPTPPPPPPIVGNTISGTASVTSTTLYGALKLNGTYYDIDVDANGDWTVQLSSPVNSLEQFVQNSNLRTIDLRDVEYDTYCDMTNMMLSSSSSVITDIWFDFRTAPNTNFMAQGAQFANVDKISIHGFGTLQWSGVVNQTNSWISDPTAQNCFSMRELCWNKIDHIFDIRGIDTMHADDSGYHVDNYAALNFNGGNGYWYKFLYNQVNFAQTLDTLIIGNLKIVFGSNPYNICSMPTLRTIYVTTTDPSFLGASSFDYIARFTNLQNIYVPVGSLNDYVNDSAWAPYISIMSEQDAPDPMTI